MTAIDWAAILGALAWLPQIITYLRNFLTVPEIRIITQKCPEIGFTSFGPILNLRIAFSVKHKDLVVSGLRLRLIHEGGEEKVFAWQGITQSLGHMSYPEVGAVPIEKESSVLAVKLNQKDIEERFIRFQEASFLNKREPYDVEVNKKLSLLREHGEVDYETCSKSDEYRALISYVKHAFSWRPGTYKLVVELESPEKFKLIGNKHRFALSAADIDALDSNKAQIELGVKQQYLPLFNDDKEQGKIVWNWRYPNLLGDSV